MTIISDIILRIVLEKATNGTHMPIKVSPSTQIPYIHKKEIPMHNVMACDFEMCLNLFGLWEGIAHDTLSFWRLYIAKKSSNFHTHLRPRGIYFNKIYYCNSLIGTF